MNYKNINKDLLKRYRVYLINKKIDLETRAIGSYWTKYKWTPNDQKTWERTNYKLRVLNKEYFYY